MQRARKKAGAALHQQLAGAGPRPLLPLLWPAWCLIKTSGGLAMLVAAAPRMPTAPSQLNSNSAAILAPVGSGIISSMTFVVVCQARTGNDISRCKSR